MSDLQQEKIVALLDGLLKTAKTCGATAADIVLSDSTSLTIARRLGKPESIHRSEEAEIGLRVFVGQRSAIVSSSDRSPEGLQQMAERAVAMARNVPEDKYAGLADADQLSKNIPDLDLYDASDVSIDTMNDMADTAEQAALEIKGITNSEGAEFGCGRDTVYFVTSNGFRGNYSSSGFSLSVSVIAGVGEGMETDYDFDSSTFLSDLEAPEKIGREAGMRTLRALSPRKGATGKVPVVFDKRVSGGLIGSLAGAISGNAVTRGTTFLKDSLGKQIFSKEVNIIDDPFIKRGSRSHPFDGEGVAPQRRVMVENGVLTGWLLDLSSARQLGLQSTGNASRGTGSPPSPKPANFYMQAGTLSFDDLIKDIDGGFYVTQLMGSGANPVTGDYSRGAKGFWIEKGRIAYPVSEMTIAGNIKDMWLQLTAANDLEIKHGIDTPTLRIDSMVVAGA
jgi:PmbA protein